MELVAHIVITDGNREYTEHVPVVGRVLTRILQEGGRPWTVVPSGVSAGSMIITVELTPQAVAQGWTERAAGYVNQHGTTLVQRAVETAGCSANVGSFSCSRNGRLSMVSLVAILGHRHEQWWQR